MRTAVKCLAGISIFVFVIAWGVMGLKLLDNNYNITTEAYIGLVSFVAFFISILYVKCTNRCPHCGKIRQSFGPYCPYCGNKLNG